MSSTVEQPIKIALRGDAILAMPKFNKGSAFTPEERAMFGLRGRLPYAVDTLDQQMDRAYQQYSSFKDDLSKNSFLQSLKAQNWILFYALLTKYLDEMFSIIYTPTEADAIAEYSHLFRKSEGLYLSPPTMDKMEEDFVESLEGRSLDLIVVSDAEAILGIGDQGSGGIGISSAKAVIYSLVAGIDPAKTLPIVLDVGTNNEDLLKDDLYVGYREKRLRGQGYDDFVEKFVGLVKKYQPHCLLHFEDFGVSNAQKLLEKYRDVHPVFNDDIQGTGAVTLAAIQAALAVTKEKMEDQRVICFGAGSAGLGIARQLRDAMVISDPSLSKADASKNFWLVDKHGLIKKSLGDKIRDSIEDEFIRKEDDWEGDETDLLAVVKAVKPTVMIGTSTTPKMFTEEVIKEMAKHVDRPIILPLSNPTRLCEVDPKDATEWTKGKALIATGSPFPPVDIPGKDKKYEIAECNNALIYPGLGLGTILSKSKKMTDKMIVAGAKRLSELAPAMKDPDLALLPPFGDAASVNFEVALAVLEQAIEEGVSGDGIPESKEERRKWAKARQWTPEYYTYEYDPKGTLV
ncbi:malate dehydrogenase (oxaloacetate-decarboxylating)(NADP+), partial [Tremellales sp. Uapishka_1]